MLCVFLLCTNHFVFLSVSVSGSLSLSISEYVSQTIFSTTSHLHLKRTYQTVGQCVQTLLLVFCFSFFLMNSSEYKRFYEYIRWIIFFVRWIFSGVFFNDFKEIKFQQILNDTLLLGAHVFLRWTSKILIAIFFFS